MKQQVVRIKEEAGRCLLCHEPKCNAACPHGIDVGRIVRALNFENRVGARRRLPAAHYCENCDAPCMQACRRGKLDVPVRLKDLFRDLYAIDVDVSKTQTDLSIVFCGVHCENPFFLSSSVVGSNYEMVAKALSMGWGGVCFKTISLLDIQEASPRFAALSKEGRSFVGFKNIEQLSDHSVLENMQIFRELKKNYPSKFILASIMGQNEEEWELLAKQCEENGADAIELNFSCPNMQEEGLGSDIGQIPELVERFTRAAKRSTTIPVLAKLTPNVATMSPAAEAALRGGADGIAAINTIKSVIGVNPLTLVSAPAVKGKSAVGGYSGNAVKPIALRFISELGQNPNLKGLHISGMGGIETWRDALEFILMGAGSIQITTAVMQYGYRIIDDLKSGLNYYLAQMGIPSVKNIIGAGLDSISETTDVLDRDSILFPKFDLDKCVGCGRCEISCNDGGHQAIKFDNRLPKLDGSKCVGCHLCLLVCPMDAISPGKKRIVR